jgi:TfoX/Sxy family transcriptional regulator of competence genes
MKWEKAPEELVQFIAEKMKKVDCHYRKMFGYPAYFIKGNMFAGLFGNNIFLRLSEEDLKRVQAIKETIKPFEPMPGKPMKGYFSIPKDVYSDDALFAKLLTASVKYVSSIPAKKKKKQK